ncbi:MAG TPA: ClpX C4-type zinc finger protein [Chloroflexia bacterium]|nr:ClpX C4-type zinc finger protein [Chloroflexia bacterium]
METGNSQSPGQPSAGTNKSQHCSFCGKDQADVAQLIANDGTSKKGGTNICNECVELCVEILGEESGSLSQSKPDANRTGRQSSQQCAFCYKDLREVRGLLPVTQDVYICNECVSLAHLIFQGQSLRPGKADDSTIYKMFPFVRNPRMKHVVGISEIVLWVADKEASLRFYRDLLGLEVISPPELRNTFLRVGEGNAGIPQMIVLVPKTDEISDKPSGYQLHHLALELPEDKFDLQQESLVQAGYQPRPGKHPVLPSRTMYVDDPDGNEVEFICRFGK